MVSTGRRAALCRLSSFVVLAAATLAFEERASGSWHNGCYRDLATSGVHPVSGSSGSDPVQCARYCAANSYDYVAVSAGSGCVCLPVLTEVSVKVDQTACASRCGLRKILPCGGEGYYSVYLSRGPFLTSVNVTVENSVYVGHMTSLEVTVTLAAVPETWLGFPVPGDADPSILQFHYQSPDFSKIDEVSVVNTSQLHTAWQHAYSREGQFTLDVTVSNLISSLSAKSNITVLYPEPGDLQMTLKTPDLDFPSCVPKAFSNLTEDISADSSAVFVDTDVKIECLLLNGVNLTFDWSVQKVTSGNEYKQNEEIGSRKRFCEGACHSDVLIYTFASVGEYLVSVKVSHQYGQLQGDLLLVVLDSKIRDLHLSLTQNDSTVATGQPVRFKVTMEVAWRSGLSLTVNYGDGHGATYNLDSTQTEARDGRQNVEGQADNNGNNDNVNVDDDDSNKNSMQRNATTSGVDGSQTGVQLKGSYGEGCLLTLTFEHAYGEEGAYRPSVMVQNGRSDVTASLATWLTAQPRLSTVYVAIDKSVVPANEPISLHAIVEPTTARNVTVTWNITDLYQNGSKPLVTYRNKKALYTFARASTYELTVDAQNAVSNVSTRFLLQAEVPVSDLELTFNRGNRFVRVGEQVMFRAEVGQGSNVDFEWDFHDSHVGQSQPVYGELYSTAVHWFTKPGQFIVSVKAFNPLNQVFMTLAQPIIVQEPVAGVSLNVPAAVPRSEPFRITATAVSGTDVMFDFDFGRGRVHASQRRQNNTVSETYSFDVVGEYNISVHAYNNISAANRTSSVHVQDVIQDFSLSTIFTPVQNEQVVFLLTTSRGSPVSRSDVIFKWILDGHHEAVTAAPLYNCTFKQTGQYNMTVEATNLVSHKLTSLVFNVTAPPGDKPRFTQGPIAVRGKPMEFTIVNIPAGPVRIEVQYKLGDEDDRDSRDDLNGSRLSWQHVFNTAGLYLVHVICITQSRSKVMMTSRILVEVPITDLKLVGPTVVPVAGAKHRWFAQMTAGSHIVYTWGLRNNFTHETTISTLLRDFTKEGVYPLAVMATNALGSAAAYVNVTVQKPIRSLHVSVLPTVIGRPTDINITVAGGPDLVFSIDFGDGNDTVLSTAKDKHTLVPVGGATSGVHMYRLRYQYWQTGGHTLRVNASNLVSYMVEAQLVTVDEAITQLVLTATTGSLVSTNSPFTVTATVATGNDLTFDFDFGEGHLLNAENHNHTCTVRYAYSEPGRYQITVYVSNPYYTTPIEGKLPYTIQAVEAMSGLTLQKQLGALSKVDCIQLYRRDSANYSTDVLRLRASLATGSDVTFHFDLGDTTQINATGRLLGQSSVGRVAAEVTHVYSSVGEFVISVSAVNPLGLLTYTLQKKLCVQVKPSGIQLDQAIYKTLFGNLTRFRVTFKAGTSLEFDWNLGDRTTYTQAISEINHRYAHPNKYDVVVEAKNRVGFERASAVVYVQSILRGVNLTVDHPVQQYDKSLTFTAIPDPDLPYGVTHYKWNFGDPARMFQRTTTHNSISYTYEKRGSYSVRVTAYNYQSDISSDPLIVQLLVPIDSLRLINQGEMVVNESIEFRAYHYYGSSVTYTWMFGTEVKNTTSSIIHHSFASEGEYTVSVTATNAISRRTATKVIFITKSYCKPPEITILGVDLSSPTQKVERSRELRIETEVKINCTMTEKALYNWTISNQSRQPIVLSELDQSIFHDSFLFLPPLALTYGTYEMTLKVRMQGVIVWSEQSVSVEIVPSPLVSVIRGGVQRYVNRNETIVLNGMLSYDPDFPEDDTLRYKWQCSDYSNAKLPCFRRPIGDVVNVTAPLISIPGHEFVLNTTAFKFNLTVIKGQRRALSVQVVGMKQTAVIDVNILCAQCPDGLINTDDRLVLEAVHSEYTEQEVEYIWSLNVVQDGSNIMIARVHDRGRCVSPDNSTYFQYVHSNMTNTDLPAPHVLLKTSTVAVTEATTTTTSTTTTTTTTVTTRLPRVNTSIMHGPIFGGSRFPPFTFQVQEDLGTGSSGRSSYPGSPGWDGHTGAMQGNRVVDDTEQDLGKPDVISKERKEIQITANMTTTGLGRRVLVLKQAVLEQGRTYVVIVTVKHKGSDIQGSALTYFRVNQSPIMGQCTISPADGGVEMETRFQVKCHSWRDTELPISYQISYSIHDNQPPDLIYQGLSSKTEFLLPVGDPEQDYKVQIHIVILDSLGAKTRVCSIDVSVKPKEFTSDNRTEEEILYDLVEEGDSALQTYIKHGDNRNARLHTKLVATRLNRLEPANDQTRELRELTRRAMLWALKDLPVRNEYEIQQTTSAVATTTAVTGELNGESMVYTTDILQKVSSQMLNLATVTRTPDDSSSLLVLQGASNVLEAMIRDEYHGRLTVKIAREIIEKSNNVVQTLMKASIKYMIVGEEPIRRQTDLLYAMAGRYKKSIVPILKSDAAVFVLPDNLETVLQAARVKGRPKDKTSSPANLQLGLDPLIRAEVMNADEDCYQAHMVTFKENPYTYGSHPDVIHTQVASLTLYTCQGDELTVENLTESEVIDIVLPHEPEQDPDGVYRLQKHQMNIHEFNLTATNRNQVLHIDISLLPAATGRLFPLAVLLRASEPPEPDKYLRKWQYPPEEQNITISITEDLLTEGVTFYIGLVDAFYNEGRRRPGQVWQRDYKLKLWWGQCLYWDNEQHIWSTNGCQLKPSSSFYQAHCSCSHLSSFGAHLSLEPNDLDSTNLEDFFNLNENPVSFSLVTTILVVYVVLLIVCRRKDRYDERKKTVVHLIDNKPTDKQLYVVTLETGFRRGAGTTAKVSIVLHGEEGMSETRELISEDEQPLFERNSRDTFILTFPDNLGPIFKVQIWHNNAGSSPSWYLSRVTVWDVNTDHVYYFICEKWFAVEEEDEKVEREITVSDHGLGFTKVALAKGSQYFADYHMWFSPLTRPSYSNFTRAQRLTCCLCLLLSYMAVNAAWYKSQEREYRGEFGLIDISWRSVLVGIITALIVLPPNMIIVLLFRKSKVTTGCSREVDAEDMYKASRKRDSMSSITSDAHIQPVLQTSIFDQTLINWQSLQDWAQKTWAKHQTEIGTVAGSEFRPLHPEDDADGDRLPGHLPADGTGSEWSPGSSTRSQAGASTSADESGSDSRKSYASHKSYCSSGTKGHSDSGSNPTPVPPTANKQARVKPRPPVLLANQMQPLAKHQQLGRGSEHGSPKSDRSTSESSMTYTTTSTEKSCDKSSGSHDVRSRWSESKSDYSGTNVSHLRYSRRRRYHLPEWCRYVAWVLCSLVIAGCATITVLYGFSFGHTKSVQWLQSLFFSFIQCAFITHPIIILVVSVVVGIRYQNDLSIFDCHDSDLVNKEVRSELKAREKVKEEEDDCDFEKGVAARQRSRYLRFTRPPQEKQLIEARMRSIKERKASAILSGTAQFLIKFILLMFMAFGKDLRPVYNLNEALKANLVRSGSPSFDSIRSVPEWWQWTQTHFLDTLYWDRWYNGQPTHFEKEYIDNSVMIGHINMRQLRIREQPCQDTNPFSHLLTTRCRYPYSPASLSQLAFGHNTTWWYMRSEITGANSVSGKHGRYDGDGFLVLLSKNKQQARSELEFLQSDMWIDKLTRVVITEFTLFHPQSNLFTSVKLLIETPATGGVSTTSYIRSVHLYRYMTALDNFVLACELLFIAVTFFKLYHVTVEFLHHRDEYLKNPWHWCVMTQGLLSLTFIVCYIYRFMLVADTVEHLRATYHEVYVDVSHVEEWDDILRCLIGFISLLVILELVRALRNRRPCAVFVSVIHHASADILVCLLMFAIWLVAYSCLGAALYVSVSPLYSQPHGALLATVGLFGRHFDFSDVEIADFWSILGLRFFVASFLVFALGSLTAYIMAVMNFHYKFYKHETILIFSNKETLLYYWDKLLVFLGFKQPILSEDDEVILPPEFTMAEIEYQVDEMLFKMNALAGTANLPEKPPVYFTDSDTTYGLGDDSLSSAGSEVRGYEEDNKLENRIRKIEERLQTDDCFSQLVQADKDVLTLDKEKQLRNQLEMEIFRQLQVHRGQTKGARPKRSTTNSSSTAGYRTSLSHSSSGSSSHSARHNADQTSSSPSPLAAGHGEPPGGSHSPSPHPNKLVQRFTFPRVPGTGKTPSSDKRQQISEPNYDNRQNNRTHSKCSSPDGVSCSCEQPGHGDLNPDQLAAVQAMRMPEANERHVTNIPLENMTMERHRSRTEGPLTNLSNEDDATQRQERSGILRKSQSQGRGKGRHPLDDIGFVNKAFDSEHDTELDRL